MRGLILGMLASALAMTAELAQAGEIAVIVKTTGSNFWQNVNKGAEAAIAAQSEHSFSFDGPATDSALTETAEGTFQAFLSTDNCGAGEEVAKRMIDETGTTGKVAVMSYVAGVGSEIGRVGCFPGYLAAHSDLEIVGPYYSQSQMALALNQTTDILASNPDLVGIFGANEPTAAGMGRAIMQAGKAGDLVALGFDGNEDLQQFVRDGLMEATAVQGSFVRGEMGVNAIARAIYFDTRILIMDEPTAALGPSETAMVADLIRQLQAEGIGILLVSHDMHDVFELCDRVVVMNKGTLVGAHHIDEVTKDDVLSLIVKGELPADWSARNLEAAQ
ncbi:substrate-binding domain-containing protein [Sagittula sp. SSi028]|uniref:substrate-binding domain-containing protein n=1 Tax=Sagittula sp. SSi028 TaxID=3400636 RepID=UPI003AF8AAA4